MRANNWRTSYGAVLDRHFAPANTKPFRRGNTVEQIILQLVSGAVGGNLAGGVMKNLSLGTLGNSIAGIVGGGIGGQILSAVMGVSAGGGMDIGSILTQVAGGGIGGGAALAVVGTIKNMMAK
jgi:hypothetical protein